MKTKRKLLAFVCILLAVLIALLGAGVLKDVVQELTFYWFDHTETELKVKAYAEEHGIFYSAYPESLIGLLERNPETETFVLEYPTYPSGVAGDYDLSEFANSDTVPLFMQWDQRWGYEKYGSDVIGITGCGPTCLAMVGYHLTGDARFTPEQVAAFAEENGYYAKGYGSSWTLISEGGGKLGLTVTELPLVEKRMQEELTAGKPIILAMGAGDFTTTGHYIVLTGIQEDKFTVNDPNSRANSSRLWSYEELEHQIRNIWSIEG